MRQQGLATGYSGIFANFDSELMQRIRKEAYGEDVGQHSWVTADELRSHIASLELTPQLTLLDFGCGPCGPLTFIAKESQCHVIGVDISKEALAAGSQRVERMELSDHVTLIHADGNQTLEVSSPIDAVISIDVLLHLRDRGSVLRDFARLLSVKGKLLFTDAGVVTGPISNEEIILRSINGYTQFVPPQYNHNALEASGFALISCEDRTEEAFNNSMGRIRAREKFSVELKAIEGDEKFAEQQRYLETVASLSEKRVLSRFVYLAEKI